jgi:hypothetical protein
MPYVGAKLAPWFDRGPTVKALVRIAEAGGERMTELTRMNTPVDKGTLRASWTTKPVTVRVGHSVGVVISHPAEAEAFVGLAQGARYESGVQTEVEYAPYVEHGTGLWGPKHAKYPIRPKHPGGWLHWIDPMTGQHVFAKEVMHPGSPGNHMLSFAAAITESEIGLIAAPALERWASETERQNRSIRL